MLLEDHKTCSAGQFLDGFPTRPRENPRNMFPLTTASIVSTERPDGKRVALITNKSAGPVFHYQPRDYPVETFPAVSIAASCSIHKTRLSQPKAAATCQQPTRTCLRNACELGAELAQLGSLGRANVHLKLVL